MIEKIIQVWPILSALGFLLIALIGGWARFEMRQVAHEDKLTKAADKIEELAKNHEAIKTDVGWLKESFVRLESKIDNISINR